MDIEKFTKMVCDPNRSEQELRTILQNTLKKDAREHAAIVKTEIDRRFTEADALKSRRSGAKPTTSSFLNDRQRFPTSKAAYLWLIEKFMAVKPDIFDHPSKNTIFIALGTRRNYFGRSLDKMFHGTPHLAKDHNNYARLSNGWYANVNLSNSEKFDILSRFAAIAAMEYETQWGWNVDDPTESLIEKQTAAVQAKRFLDEFRLLDDELKP